ncbi:MAG: bifunctional phosphoribosyl-AMP cyclohydrolase/phosphoribosyl-ATP diphosphatase HisIE [Methanobacteriota archaeon]
MVDDEERFTVVAQDADTGDVLTVAHGNEESLRLTRETGLLHLWSRSRGRLWKKGEESGNVQDVVSLTWDCDRDALLAKVRPHGPACHTGTTTCFGEPTRPANVITELEAVIRERETGAPPGSYVARLLGDPPEIRKKVGEEAIELIHASERGRREDVVHEAADLLFHVLVLLYRAGVPYADVLKELEVRRR